MIWFDLQESQKGGLSGLLFKSGEGLTDLGLSVERGSLSGCPFILNSLGGGGLSGLGLAAWLIWANREADCLAILSQRRGGQSQEKREIVSRFYCILFDCIVCCLIVLYFVWLYCIVIVCYCIWMYFLICYGIYCICFDSISCHFIVFYCSLLHFIVLYTITYNNIHEIQ